MIGPPAVSAALLAAACAATRPPPEPPPRGAAGGATLIVLDGFGLAGPGPGNAIDAALRDGQTGPLARALVAGDPELPWVPLGASGTCVGLDEGMVGNSEAGHNALCAGGPVLQRRIMIDRLVQDGGLAEAEPLNGALAAAASAGRRVHVIAYAADSSSAGDAGHIAPVLRLAAERGVRDLSVHVICDGRGERRCAELLAAANEVLDATKAGRYATFAGRVYCIVRGGQCEATDRCVAGFRRELESPSAAVPERSTADVFAELSPDPLLDDTLEPTPVEGGRPITDDDLVILLTYRRDVSEGILRGLRHRREGEPPSPRGPTVITFGLLDSRERYADDPHLIEAFDHVEPPGHFHRLLAERGIPQMRIAEHEKAAHVTYFCDLEHVPQSELYRTIHPRSPGREDYVDHPCLRSETTVAAGIEFVRAHPEGFLLMNLPNADILGHHGDIAAAIAGVKCLDRVLSDLVTAARDAGHTVFITADHGNAEAMLRDGEPYFGHTANPVPLIAIAPRGEAPLHLRRDPSPACLGHVTWTVLDALGLAEGDPRSLLVR